MRSLTSLVAVMCAAMFLTTAEAGVFADLGPFQSASKVRKRIDETTQQTLDRLEHFIEQIDCGARDRAAYGNRLHEMTRR